MKQMLGFIFFWIAVGMTIMLFLSDLFWSIVIIIVLLICAYNLFFCP